MTIAIGIISEDGIVLASDTEESTPTMKASASKMIFGSTDERSVVIVGAGPDCHIETAAELLREELLKDVTDHAKLKQACRACLEKYYRDHVLCWPTITEREDNDFALLIATSDKNNEQNSLWVTRQSTLREVGDTSAVGLGAMYARTLMRESGVGGECESRLAVPVAVEVVRRVKREVPGCGQDTEIVILMGGFSVSSSNRANYGAEAILKEFENLTRDQFDVVTSPVTPEHSYYDEMIAKVPQKLQRLRANFQEWSKKNTDDLIQLARECRGEEEQPKPSPRKSKDKR